jgi:outer membrane protein assembly factor BamB
MSPRHTTDFLRSTRAQVKFFGATTTSYLMICVCVVGLRIAAPLFMVTNFNGYLDARILAFDRMSGRKLWESEIIEYYRGFSATSAPLIVKDLAIIGVGGGEFGVRGFFDAYDVNSGERVWRHYTVPAEGSLDMNHGLVTLMRPVAPRHGQSELMIRI